MAGGAVRVFRMRRQFLSDRASEKIEGSKADVTEGGRFAWRMKSVSKALGPFHGFEASDRRAS